MFPVAGSIPPMSFDDLSDSDLSEKSKNGIGELQAIPTLR